MLADRHSSLYPPLPPGRDDLFRVELDIVAGDEMFYSKVSTFWTDTHSIHNLKEDA